MTLTVGALCAGYGGLELAVADLFRPPVTFAWTSEIDPAASAVLAARFTDTPNLGDLTDPGFDPPPVDVVTAGFPCQPISQAGNRNGRTDDRWIWPAILAAISRMDPRPGVVMLENVPGLLTIDGGHAMADVVHGLASLGYVGRYRLAAASDVGLAHRRRRLFIVAATSDARLDRIRPDRRIHGRAGRRPAERPGLPAGPNPFRSVDTRPDDGGGLLPTPIVSDARNSRRDSARSDDWSANPGTSLSDVAYLNTFGEYAAAIARHAAIIGREPPTPTAGVGITPEFVEWLMALPAGWVTAVAGLNRRDKLSILGNGVVPLQASAAYEPMIADLTLEAHR